MLFLNAAAVFSPLNKSCVDGIDVGVHCTSNKEKAAQYTYQAHELAILPVDRPIEAIVDLFRWVV